MKKPLNIISFNWEIIPDIKTIGGKALSLIKLKKLNINVPPGIILSFDFFSDWLKLITLSTFCSKLINEIKD